MVEPEEAIRGSSQSAAEAVSVEVDAKAEKCWRHSEGQVAGLTAAAFTWWSILCLLDLLGCWPSFGPDSAISPVLGIFILILSCSLVVWRRCCRRMQELTGCMGCVGCVGCPIEEKFLLLASQWSLFCGCLAWLVFHAANLRAGQVIAACSTSFALLAFFLCSLALLKPWQTARLGLPDRREEGLEDGLHNILEEEEEEQKRSLSVTKQSDLEVKLRTSARSVESEQSANFVGHSLSRTSVRSALKGDIETIRHVDFQQANRSSRGRWRPLFPTLMLDLTSPTASRSTASRSLASIGLGDSLRRSFKFKFETDAEVEESLVNEIKRHTLAVNEVIQRQTSPSPSMSSVPSVPSQSDKAPKASRASSSSGLSDISGRSQLA